MDPKDAHGVQGSGGGTSPKMDRTRGNRHRISVVGESSGSNKESKGRCRDKGEEYGVPIEET